MTESDAQARRPPSEDREIRAGFTKSQQDRGMLLRTIAAMANTRGGRIVLHSADGAAAGLDAEGVEALVNEYVAPRIEGLSATVTGDGTVEIVVPDSEAKPHVFVTGLDYQIKGRTRGAFFPGQIWVRHGSRSEPADAHDVERIIRERTSRFLGDLSATITNPAFPLHMDPDAIAPARAGEGELDVTEAAAAEMPIFVDPHADVAIRVTTDPDAAPVNIDINRSYPFTTTALGESLGRSTNWAAAAVRALRLKGDLHYHYPVRNADGRVIVNKYSEAALERLRDQVERDPEWNPWAAG